MNAVLALGGWLVAAAGFGTAVLLRIQLLRHLEAVAQASHELRGPLTAVRLGLELSARARPPSPPRLRAIELELGRAALALEDLSAARVRRKEVTSTAELVDLSELVIDSVEAWRPFAKAREATLCVRSVDSEARVSGQRLRLAQAIGNLIANAIEHGGGEVEVSLRSEAGAVRVEIVDGGLGLPAPVDELVRRRERRHGARGHGLAIVSQIAAAHGGRIAAAPSHCGARLVLELPVATDLGDIVGL
jgi:signal transduction histidine kinase